MTTPHELTNFHISEFNRKQFGISISKELIQSFFKSFLLLETSQVKNMHVIYLPYPRGYVIYSLGTPLGRYRVNISHTPSFQVNNPY